MAEIKMVSDKALAALRERFGDLSKITGDELRMHVAEVARSFIGCKEKSVGHLLLMDVYNEQEDLPRGHRMTMKDAWCAMFCVAVSILAGVADAVPSECSCSKLIELAKGMGIWVENEAKHKARVGDWCVYDWDDNGRGDNTGAPDHIGIVTERGERGFTVTEGNYSNQVKDRHMEDNGKRIRGFICPDYDALAAAVREAVTVAGFRDVPEGVYYQEALEWAEDKGIVFGVADGLFAPDKELTRAEAVAMLYRIWCVVKPAGVVLPFADVPEGAWYHDALEWAHHWGIVFGRSAEEFGAEDPILRCELAAILWRLMASPKPKGHAIPFADVAGDAWYYPAVAWAWEQGIVYGVGGNRFAPADGLLRRDAVCLIHRWYQKV